MAQLGEFLAQRRGERREEPGKRNGHGCFSLCPLRLCARPFFQRLLVAADRAGIFVLPYLRILHFREDCSVSVSICGQFQFWLRPAALHSSRPIRNPQLPRAARLPPVAFWPYMPHHTQGILELNVQFVNG